MKLNFTLLLFLTVMFASAQQTEFALQGKITDSENNPVGDAYILNIRNSMRCFSLSNGLFELRVLPSDTLIISHISYLRKVVTVFDVLKNPVIVVEPDTMSIKPVNVTGINRREYEQAKKNINAAEFDPLPRVSDNFSQTDRTTQLMKTENRVMRTEASSVKIASFSPSQVIGKLSEKRKKRKEASQYDSTRKLPKEETEELKQPF